MSNEIQKSAVVATAQSAAAEEARRGNAAPNTRQVIWNNNWRDRAACKDIGAGAEEFFPEKGGGVRQAKVICNGCPVSDHCLTVALVDGEKFGVWGGESESERRKIAAKLDMGTEAPVEAGEATLDSLIPQGQSTDYEEVLRTNVVQDVFRSNKEAHKKHLEKRAKLRKGSGDKRREREKVPGTLEQSRVNEIFTGGDYDAVRRALATHPDGITQDEIGEEAGLSYRDAGWLARDLQADAEIKEGEFVWVTPGSTQERVRTYDKGQTREQLGDSATEKVTVGNGDSGTLIEDKSSTQAETTSEHSQQQRVLEALSADFPEREKTILRLQHGMNGLPVMEPEEIAKWLEISPADVVEVQGSIQQKLEDNPNRERILLEASLPSGVRVETHQLIEASRESGVFEQLSPEDQQLIADYFGSEASVREMAKKSGTDFHDVRRRILGGLSYIQTNLPQDLQEVHTKEHISLKTKKGRKFKVETREKMSQAHKGIQYTPERNEKVKAGLKGRKRPIETKIKISLAVHRQLAEKEQQT